MGTMGPLLTCSASPLGVAGSPEVLLQGYRSCLQEALLHLVQVAPTSDPRVLALTAHLARRQAAYELQEEVRRHRQQGLQDLRDIQDLQDQPPQLLDQYFRGVDLHYTR